MNLYQKIEENRTLNKLMFAVLIDPDKHDLSQLRSMVELAHQS